MFFGSEKREKRISLHVLQEKLIGLLTLSEMAAGG
jgi:hypothetical protein